MKSYHPTIPDKSRFIEIILLISIFVSLCAFTTFAQIGTSREFEYIPTGGASVNSIFSDCHGRMFAASSDGLLIYGGKTFNQFPANAKGVTCEENINGALPIGDDNLLLCTTNGLYNLDFRSHIFSFIYETASLDVRAIARLDTTFVVLATSTGLVTVNSGNKQTRKLQSAPARPYYSLLVTDKKAYAGFNGGITAYDTGSNICDIISLDGGDNINVTALALDNIRKCIWIGTDKGLARYFPESSGSITIDKLGNLSINAIMVDGVGDVWVGTNAGLFEINEETGLCNHYTHNAQDRMSIIDNDVKSLYEDDHGNIWIGTEVGVAFLCRNSNFVIQRWSHLSNSTAGDRITSILIDAEHSLWIGGTNGLLKCNGRDTTVQPDNNLLWFQGHRINSIFEDSDKNVWAATDRGISLFHKGNGRPINFIIKDSTGKYSAVNCTNVFEDASGNICVSASGSGVFLIDKQRLTHFQSDAAIICDRHLYTFPGTDNLISKKIDLCVADNNGNLWVAAGVDGLTKIYSDSGRVEYFSFTQSEKHLNVKDIESLYCDNEGIIWVAGKGNVDRIDPNNDAITHISGGLLAGKTFNSITDKDDNVWLLYPGGIVVMNKETHHMADINLPETNYSCLFLDNATGFIWAGGMDHVIQFSPEAILMPSSTPGSLTLSSLIVNNQEIFPDKEYDGNIILHQGLPYTKEITLKPSQNNIDLEFTGARSDRGSHPRYRYRLSTSDNSWREIDGTNLHIPLYNLSQGTYTLQIEQLENDGTPTTYPPYELKIKVLPHWYLSIWAKIVYALLVAALILWVVKYSSMKSKLKFERLEKEKVKELSDMKVNFLTDIAHELKTPLSLILEPLNKLISTSKGSEQKAALQTVRNNALHLGKLIRQALDLRNANIEELGDKMSPLEMVEFVGSIVATFKEAADNRNIGLGFNPPEDGIVIMTDVLKMESILRNLISNALKFTPEGGIVEVGLGLVENEGEKSVVLTVADNGVGIPAEDIPKIFDRFYQSEHSRGINKDGSGIGLSMVKTFVSQFNGDVRVESQPGRGTTFTINLPVIAPDKIHSDRYNEEGMDDDVRGVRVLIVEDNAEIARFISENLKKMDCRIAHNGKSGFETAKTFAPDVVISDIMMPVMDGIEMSRLLKNNPSTSAIPIILLTAKDDRHTEYDAYGIGVDAFIPKPFEVRQLIIRIRQLLKSKLAAQDSMKAAASDERTASVLDSLATADERFKDEITNIIEEHIDDPELNVQRLADLSGVNAKQIYRKIKLTTGTTVVDYIKSIRMKKAALLLSQKQFTVSEVMYMVGFSSSSYFSKCFMEKYGKTPKSYLDESD